MILKKVTDWMFEKICEVIIKAFGFIVFKHDLPYNKVKKHTLKNVTQMSQTELNEFIDKMYRDNKE